MAYDKQYDDPKLWKLVSDKAGKDYVSAPAAVPERWSPRSIKNAVVDLVIYVSGEYEIRGHRYGTRRSYTVWRNGVELPLSFTGQLKDAKERAVKNARGEDRMHLA